MSGQVVVTVYTSGPGCQACTLTKRHLDKRGIAYTEVAIDSSPGIFDAAQFLGFTTAPIVCASTPDGEQAWDGYRPDRINALAGAK